MPELETKPEADSGLSSPATEAAAAGGAVTPPPVAAGDQEPEMVATPDTLDTERIEGIDILAADSYPQGDVTRADLDHMVAAHNAIGAQVDPYLKLKHGEANALEDAPLRLGHWENLRRVGDKLFGDLRKVPKAIAALMKVGALGRPSGEVYHDYKGPDGKTYPRVLRAAVLTANEQPAGWRKLRSLEGIKTLYNENSGASPGRLVTYGQEEKPMPEKITAPATPEATPEAKLYAELEQQKATNAQQAAELKKYRDDAKAQQDRADKLAKAAKTTTIASMAETLKRDEFMTPAGEAVFKQYAEALNIETVIEYSEAEDKKPVPLNPLQFLEKFIRANGKVLNYGEVAHSDKGADHGNSGKTTSSSGVPVEGAQASATLKLYAEEHEITFGAAIERCRELADGKGISMDAAAEIMAKGRK